MQGAIAYINQNEGFFVFLATAVVALFSVGTFLLWLLEWKRHRLSRSQLAVTMRQYGGRITNEIVWLDNERERDRGFQGPAQRAVRSVAVDLQRWKAELKQIAERLGPKPPKAVAYVDWAILSAEQALVPVDNLLRLCQVPADRRDEEELADSADNLRSYLKRMAGALDGAYQAFPWWTRLLRVGLSWKRDYIEVVREVEVDLDERFPTPGDPIPGREIT